MKAALTLQLPILIEMSDRPHTVAEGLVDTSRVEVRVGKIRRQLDAALIAGECLPGAFLVLQRHGQVEMEQRFARQL